MRVLLTNHVLQGRTGTEVYIFELALSLLKRGHLPVVYSPRLGPLADELRVKTVPVIDDLRLLAEPPDIIHAHHSPPAVEALLRFPYVPSLFVCHDRLAWHDQPPHFDRFLRYVAVDYNCRERLIAESGIDPSRVLVLLNSADLARFKERPPLPNRPQRALIFSNQDTQVKAITEACRQAGIEVETLHQFRAQGATPEAVLPHFDLVFAKARCAIEAMAVGAAVIVCDDVGLGGMVTSENFDHARALNFGRRFMQGPLKAADIVGEIAKYQADDALKVAQRIRVEASLEHLVDQWLALYEEIVAEFDPKTISLEREMSQAADYLRLINPWLKDISLVSLYRRSLELGRWWFKSWLRSRKRAR